MYNLWLICYSAFRCPGGRLSKESASTLDVIESSCTANVKALHTTLNGIRKVAWQHQFYYHTIIKLLRWIMHYWSPSMLLHVKGVRENIISQQVFPTICSMIEYTFQLCWWIPQCCCDVKSDSNQGATVFSCSLLFNAHSALLLCLKAIKNHITV